MATISRDRRTDEMLKVALFCARFAENADHGSQGREPPRELEAKGWTAAFRQFYPNIAGDREEARYLGSIRRDFEAFSQRIEEKRPLRPSRSELIDRYMVLPRAEFWEEIRQYRTSNESIGTQPSDPLDDIATHAAEFREVTEREAIVKARIGQGPFRSSLIQRWKVCAVTGCSETSVLRASHIKPWRVSDNAERLDVNNGLLLVPNLDALFDCGLISFDDSGQMIVASDLTERDRRILGIAASMRLSKVPLGILGYLRFHREYFGF